MYWLGLAFYCAAIGLGKDPIPPRLLDTLEKRT
jgi:hypothetical protein